MDMSVDRDTDDFVVGMLQDKMGHFWANPGERHQVCIAVWNEAIVLIVDYLSRLFDVDGLLIVETYFGDPSIEVVGVCCHDGLY